MGNAFEPSIIAFCCRWRSCAAADPAGTMKLRFPANVKIILIPCTSRADIKQILNAIETGAEGVFLSGSLVGDCYYISGKIKAAKRISRVKRLLEVIGIEPERVEMFYNAASTCPQFADTCIKFRETIRA